MAMKYIIHCDMVEIIYNNFLLHILQSFSLEGVEV